MKISALAICSCSVIFDAREKKTPQDLFDRRFVDAKEKTGVFDKV